MKHRRTQTLDKILGIDLPANGKSSFFWEENIYVYAFAFSAIFVIAALKTLVVVNGL